MWAVRRTGVLQATVLSFVFGTAYGCWVAAWIPEALAELGSSQPTAVAGWILTAAWAKEIPFAAIGLVVWGVRRAPAAVQIAVCALVVYGTEHIISAWRFGVPWALLGHSQLGLPGVAQLAVVGGVPLLSAWLASINMAVALALGGCRVSRHLAATLVGSWLAAAWLGLPAAERVRPPPPDVPELRLLIVQPQIPRYARWDDAAQSWILDTTANQSAAALSELDSPVAAVVWPENLLTSPVEADSSLLGELQRRVAGWGAPLITGAVRAPLDRGRRGYRSSVLWIEPGGRILAALDKSRAVPLVESSHAFPGGFVAAPWFGEAARWPKVEEAPTDGAALDGRFSAAAVLCYEALFPGVVAQRRSRDSRVILNLADDSWVHGDTATQQLTAWAAFRAIEQRLPLVRVAHGGLSAVVDPFGEIVARLPLHTQAHRVLSLRASAVATPEEKAALMGLPLLAGLGVWWLLPVLLRQTKSQGRSEP